MEMRDEQFIMDNVNVKKLKGKILNMKLLSFFIFLFLFCILVLAIVHHKGLPNKLENLFPCIIIFPPIIFYFCFVTIANKSVRELIFEDQSMRIVTLTGIEVEIDYSNLTFTEGKFDFVYLETLGRS